MNFKISLLLLALALPLTAHAADAPKYHILRHMAVGGDGGWDYLTFDPAGHRLFIARSTRVMVVDVASGQLSAEIVNTPGVHGIALVPDAGQGFASNGRESTVTVFDLKDLHEIARIKVGDTPDAIVYDPFSKRVFTFNAKSKDTTAIDVASGKVAGTIPLGGKPEFSVSDGRGHMYVNNEDKSEIVEFDPQALKETHRWKLTGCESPSGLAMDRKNRRLFAGCDNKKMAVMNADSGAVITTLAIGDGVDANAFDPETMLAFSSNGEGNLTVVHEDSPDKFTIVETVPTEKGARTMALDPETHKVYVVTAKFGPAPAPTAEAAHPRPSILPNSFEVIELGQ
jgi:DNA-binding beta-propeller fold protein YncE